MKMLGFLLVIVCLLVDGKPTKDEVAERKYKVFEKCSKNITIPESVFKGFFDMENIEGFKGNECVVKCILDEYRIIKEDRSIDTDKFGSFILEKPEDQNKINLIAKDCSDREKKLSDTCDYNYGLMECVIDEMKKMKTDTKLSTKVVSIS